MDEKALQRLRELRGVLDELNVEVVRKQEEHRTASEAFDAAWLALRDNPSSETAAACVASNTAWRATWSGPTDARDRQRKVRNEMVELHKKLHVSLGVELRDEDYDR